MNIFNDNNANSIDEINNIVINETLSLFSEKLKNKPEENNYDSNTINDYDSLFAERTTANAN